MRILGISAFHSDAAAALIVGGTVVAAAQEERFSRKPLDPGFPKRAIRYCLQHGAVKAGDLDRVVFYEKPLRKFERVLATQLAAFPKSGRTFARSAFIWLGDRLWIKNHIARELGIPVERIGFVEHQIALATHALCASGVDAAAVLTVDDAGEWATTTLGRGQAGQVELLREIMFPHSLGFVVSALTQFLGFQPGGDEHLVEALSAYGKPTALAAMRSILPAGDGGFMVDQDCFRYAFDSERLYSDALVERLGPPRFSGDPLCFSGEDTRHADLAASLQVVLEERILELAHDLYERVPEPDLCFAGELAKNTRVVGRLVQDGPFRAVHVPVAPGKAGAALGAAYRGWVAAVPDGAIGPAAVALGEAVDDRAEAGATELAAPVETLLSRLLAGQKVGWVRGRMEFGARSFGNRSILATVTGPDAPRALLGAIQHVEAFLPIRLALPTEVAAQFVVIPAGAERAVGRGALRVAATAALRARAPHAVEPDGLVQVHCFARDADPDFHRLLVGVGAAGGAPLLFLADFAPRGVPLVRNEANAVDAFRRSALDALVVGSRLYVPV